MACEIQPELRELYLLNFGLRPWDDIRALDPDRIPPHQLLCAGFPCQPFSKAGEQLGLSCVKDGDLFGRLLRIIRHRRPPLLMLENVANLARHDAGATYQKMVKKLQSIGYVVDQRVLSPHQFGIPQIRERLFIVGSLAGLAAFQWPAPTGAQPHIRAVLDPNPPEAKPISRQYALCLDAWQEFLDRFPANEELPSFPIWSMEFGADYPFEHITPSESRDLGRYRGPHGRRLSTLAPEQRLETLPSYARSAAFPTWKKTFIRQNRALYARHHRWIDTWIPRIANFPPSLQKLEWNCKGERRSLGDHIIQFRASGVRVKRAAAAPALIAMTTTQVPIVAAEGRYMTVRECARLQGLGDLKSLPQSSTKAYRALGNAVNADLVELIARRLILACGGSNMAA
jgi:DNA (cytosine-5)-methyltransferase 1